MPKLHLLYTVWLYPVINTILSEYSNYNTELFYIILNPFHEVSSRLKSETLQQSFLGCLLFLNILIVIEELLNSPLMLTLRGMVHHRGGSVQIF